MFKYAFLGETNRFEGDLHEKYEYKFVEIPRIGGLKVKSSDTFEECKGQSYLKRSRGGD